MATPPELARSHYEQVTSTIRAIIAQIQALWRTLSPDRIEDDLLGEAGATIAAATIAGQISVADAAAVYIAAQMIAQGASPAADGRLDARAFSGLAPGGGPLESLLFLPAIGVRRRLAAGLPPAEAMIGGLADMSMYVSTAIADTARAADQAAMTATPSCVAYVRVVRLPACSRCIVLSGQMYSQSEGFLRHPRCDCQTLPLAEREWPDVPTPQQLFDRLDARQQQRVFTVAGARAIREGGDVGQVVNARRGMSTASVHGREVQATSEGTTRRGLYGRRRARAGDQFARFAGQRHGTATSARYLRTVTTPRLMPEEIFRLADGDRAHAIRLLARNGYLRDGPSGTASPPPAGRSRNAPPPAGAGGAGGAPPVPPGSAPGPAAGGDEVPLMGDLLPVAGGSTDVARLEDGLRALFAGDFAGFTVEVTRVRPAANRVMVTANVMRDGELAGEIWRTFRRDEQGRLYAKHDLLELGAPFRRRGFSNAVNAHLEDWYRRSGAHRIELNAGMDNGGYVWAAKGYLFASAEEAENIAERLERQLDALESWLEEHKDDDGTPDDEYESAEDAYSDGEALLRRMHDEPFGSPGFPAPGEIADLGRLPHHTAADSWLGKRVLMGSSWNGVKYL
ncbi:hypothetical protein AB0D49_08215 [Streptomyces sp. NPDC048290]|uniref:hypothetical protein n=1 Tax=Streptomyces sp. NPDC048290 TaxID=3155811 RepID=UPI0034255683